MKGTVYQILNGGMTITHKDAEFAEYEKKEILRIPHQTQQVRVVNLEEVGPPVVNYDVIEAKLYGKCFLRDRALEEHLLLFYYVIEPERNTVIDHIRESTTNILDANTVNATKAKIKSEIYLKGELKGK